MILVIPMAGEGSRFMKDGYNTVKPLIEFQGKTMVEHVIEPFKKYGKITKIVAIIRKDHIENYDLANRLKAIDSTIETVTIAELTEGAACSILLAKEHINNDQELAICNCDNIIETQTLDIPKDGKIYTFEVDDASTKWSYAKLDENGYVLEVAEKQPISTHATAGLYMWKRGSDFVRAAESMIAQNIRYNNEFYLAPVYNQNIKAGQKIEIEEVVDVNIVGTPEDLDAYLAKSEQTA